jgi:hypothetical protein
MRLKEVVTLIEKITQESNFQFQQHKLPVQLCLENLGFLQMFIQVFLIVYYSHNY